MRRKTYTVEELKLAAAKSSNLRQLLLNLNLSAKGVNYTLIKLDMKNNNIVLSDRIGPKHIRSNTSDIKIINAVKTSISYASILSKLGLDHNTGVNNAWIRSKIGLLKLDISHLLGQAHNKGQTFPTDMERLKSLLRVNNFVTSSQLRVRLIKSGLIENQCEICKLLPEWHGTKLTLQLDHINGDNTDNRIENLRLLCPNCHSQTITFCRGKNKTHPDSINDINLCEKPLTSNTISYCISCMVQLKTEGAKLCQSCYNKDRKKYSTNISYLTKISWPSSDELQKLVFEHPTYKLALMLGVSDKAIEKRCKKLGLTKPPRGYWNKLKANIES